MEAEIILKRKTISNKATKIHRDQVEDWYQIMIKEKEETQNLIVAQEIEISKMLKRPFNILICT